MSRQVQNHLKYFENDNAKIGFLTMKTEELEIKINKIADKVEENSRDIAVINSRKCAYGEKMGLIDDHLKQGEFFRERQKAVEVKVQNLESWALDMRGDFKDLRASFGKLYWSIIGTIVSMFAIFIGALINLAK